MKKSRREAGGAGKNHYQDEGAHEKGDMSEGHITFLYLYKVFSG